jgi:hypothetical protein
VEKALDGGVQPGASKQKDGNGLGLDTGKFLKNRFYGTKYYAA